MVNHTSDFQKLYLDKNPALTIPTDRNFIQSLCLSHLDISHCNINSVSVGTRPNVSALKWLDLSDNNLSIVDIIYWQCCQNCPHCICIGTPYTVTVRCRKCGDGNIEAVYDVEPKCVTPNEVEGMAWGC